MSAKHEGAPDFKAPPLACDAHFHVFGPAERYPYGSDLRYPPPLAPLEGLRISIDPLGPSRALVGGQARRGKRSEQLSVLFDRRHGTWLARGLGE